MQVKDIFLSSAYKYCSVGYLTAFCQLYRLYSVEWHDYYELLIRKWRQTYCKIPDQLLPGSTEEIHESPQSVFGLIFEPGTSKY